MKKTGRIKKGQTWERGTNHVTKSCFLILSDEIYVKQQTPNDGFRTHTMVCLFDCTKGRTTIVYVDSVMDSYWRLIA